MKSTPPDRAAQNTDSGGTILRLAPDSFARDSHGAESKPSYAKIVSDHESATLRGYAVLHMMLSPNFNVTEV